MAFLYGFIGENGTGKSVTAKLIAELWKKKNPKGKIYVHDLQGDFEDIADGYIHSYNKKWALEMSKKTNCLLILDEKRVLHPSAQTQPDVLQLLARRRKSNINIIFIVHNPKLILESFTYFTNKFFVFATNSREGSWSDKIPNYELAFAGSRLINNYTAKINPKDYAGLYPNFPHIIIDTKRNKLLAQNINHKIWKS